MSYYWFYREKILKNAWDKYHNKRGKESIIMLLRCKK